VYDLQHTYGRHNVRQANGVDGGWKLCAMWCCRRRIYSDSDGRDWRDRKHSDEGIMACIVWRNTDGSEYVMAENESHTPAPGAYNTGIVRWDCGKSTPSEEVEKMLGANSIQWGDAIAWVTKKFGVQQCSPCKARQEILNNVAENGWADTLKQLKETFNAGSRT